MMPNAAQVDALEEGCRALAPSPASWAPEVFVEGKWSRNSLRFVTREHAETYAADLFSRWTLTEAHRAAPATEPPNYTIAGGSLVALSEGAP